MPMGVGGSPWWSPTPQTGSYTDTNLPDWSKIMLEQSPQTGWYRYGRELGVGDDNSAFSQWFKKQYPQFQQGYDAYSVSNPMTANITDYANSLGGMDQWMRQFQSMDPRLKGESPGDRGGGPSRWIMR